MAVVPWQDYLAMRGYCYLVQLGTEDAPVALTGTLDDALAIITVDVPTSVAVIPISVETPEVIQ